MKRLFRPRRRSPHRTLLAWNSGAEHPAGAARQLLRHFLAELRVDDAQIDDALVMTSELVTNAVRHAQGPYELRIRRTQAEVIVEVHDRTCHIPVMQRLPVEKLIPVQDHDRGSGADALLARVTESGRGLGIVASLSVGCAGGRRTPTGKAMWFAVPTPSCEPTAQGGTP